MHDHSTPAVEVYGYVVSRSISIVISYMMQKQLWSIGWSDYWVGTPLYPVGIILEPILLPETCQSLTILSTRVFPWLM